MGQLVKANSSLAHSDEPVFDEDRFVRDAQETAELLQAELHGRSQAAPESGAADSEPGTEDAAPSASISRPALLRRVDHGHDQVAQLQLANQQLEEELRRVTARHQFELEDLRRKLDPRSEHSRLIIQACNARLAELASAQQAAVDELETVRSAIAREREEFDRQRAAATALLNHQRSEWESQFARQQRELADLRRTTEEKAAASRAHIESEQAEWTARLEEIRQRLAAESRQHQQSLADSRTELARTIELEEQHIADRRRELAQLEQELQNGRNELAGQQVTLRTTIEQLQSLLQQRREEHEQELRRERDEWHQERGREASILQAERRSLDAEREQVNALRQTVEARIQTLEDELQARSAAHEEKLQRFWQEQRQALLQSDREHASRQRLMQEKLQQQESELTARQKQIETELQTTRMLHEKQLRMERDALQQTTALRQSELDHRQRELNELELQLRQRAQELEQSRLRLEEEIRTERRLLDEKLQTRQRLMDEQLALAREQLEQERATMRTGLAQMDAQLRMISSAFTVSAPFAAQAEAPAVTPASAKVVSPGPAAAVSEPEAIPVEQRPAAHRRAAAVEDITPAPTEWLGPVEPSADQTGQESSAATAEVQPRDRPAGSHPPVVNEWIGYVAPQVVDEVAAADTAAVRKAPSGEGAPAGAEQDIASRRQALEGYRERLSELQAQLRDLTALAASRPQSQPQ